jgi:subtilisin family serine protease
MSRATNPIFSSIFFLTIFFLSACETTIDEVTPTEVNSSGGTTVLISGSNLDNAAVTVDSTKVIPTSNTSKSISFVAPPHLPGKATVNVRTDSGSDSFEDLVYVAVPENKYIIEFHINEGLQAFIDSPNHLNQRINEVLQTPLFEHKKITSFNSLPYRAVDDLTDAEIEELRNNPFVKGVHRNAYRETQIVESLKVVEQQQAYEWGATGAGYSIAILDTGADYARSDLGACKQPGADCKVIVSFDTATEDGMKDADPDQHGTNVASIAARMAPKANIIAIDVFDKRIAFDDDILEALNWIITNRQKYNIVAVNMSLGAPLEPGQVCETLTYDNALKLLLHVGIQVVVAAGNNGHKDRVSYPACHPLAITVGATTDSQTLPRNYPVCSDGALPVDAVTCFSDSSRAVDVYAPGVNITARGRTQTGTSQAAPHVAGALAALKSKFPARTTEELILRIQQTGKPVTDSANGLTRFRINLASAMNDAPVAVDDSATSLQGGGVVIDVLANDLDEHIENAKISGLVVPDSEDIYAKIINNEVYFYSEPHVHGVKKIKYTMIDEYGVTAAAEITVDIRKSNHSTTNIVTPEYSYRSHLIRSQQRPYIVYESGRFEQNREVWMQRLDESGNAVNERYLVSRDNADVSPNYLEAKGNDEGYNIAWIASSKGTSSKVMGAYARNFWAPEVFTASTNHKGSAWNPSVTLLKWRAIYGWEDARNPGDMFAQPVTRTGGPTPTGDLQTLVKNVAFTADYDTVSISDKDYLHLKLKTGSDVIAVRKFDLNGSGAWADIKKIPDWMGSPPDFFSGLCCSINKFSSVTNANGFSLGWSHATYAGKYGISFQEFDFDGNATNKPITVLDKLNSKGGVQLIKFTDGSHRIFWNEYHGNFGAIVSANISGDGKLSPKRIDYWTEDGNALWPYSISALALNNNNYVLSWSNNKRQLTSITRER